jgi:hypothetical protein
MDSSYKTIREEQGLIELMQGIRMEAADFLHSSLEADIFLMT